MNFKYRWIVKFGSNIDSEKGSYLVYGKNYINDWKKLVPLPLCYTAAVGAVAAVAENNSISVHLFLIS